MVRARLRFLKLPAATSTPAARPPIQGPREIVNSAMKIKTMEICTSKLNGKGLNQP